MFSTQTTGRAEKEIRIAQKNIGGGKWWQSKNLRKGVKKTTDFLEICV